MRRAAALLLLALLLLTLPACAGNRAESGRLRAIATAFPEYDLLRALGGERLELTLLLKPGTEAHSFEPTPQDLLAIRSAALFVYGGGESDVWARRLLDSGEIGDTAVIAPMAHALLRREETEEYMTLEEAGEEGDVYDEHVWTSPQNVILLAEALRDTLITLDPAGAEEYKANAEDYIAKLRALDESFRALKETAARDLLVFGDRFPFLYFVREYGFRYAAAFPGCAGETDANPATVAYLIDLTKEEGIPVVFKCDLSAGLLADTIAEAAGAKVLTLYSAHTVSKADFDAGETLLSLMERNLASLREALG